MINPDMYVIKRKVWSNYGIDLLKSDNLIHWSSVTFDFLKGPLIFIEPESKSVYKDFFTVRRIWAPQIFWEKIIGGEMETKVDISFIILC